MKKILCLFAFAFGFLYAFAQVGDPSGFTEEKIESGTVYKKYKDNKLDSIVLGMAAVNYGNALIFSKTANEIRITSAEDKNSVIKISLKNGKQIRTFFYKDKPAIILESIDIDLKNLPKNSEISSGILNGIVGSFKLSTHYENFGEDNPDKAFKLFYRLDIPVNLDKLDSIFEGIGNFFSEEDSLLKIYYGDYSEKFAPQALAYFKTDNLGKIKDGIILDLKSLNASDKHQFRIYKDGKVTKSGTTNVADFQPIFVEYREKQMDEE